MHHARRPVFTILATTLVALSLVIVPGTTAPSAGAAGTFRPMIFVHGFAGSGSQFAAQAMRFASNGYRIDDVSVLEYDSSFANESQSDVLARLDTLIAQVKARTGTDQIDLLGHSLGTGLMQGYLNSDPARAADVAHYVNLDGAPAGAPPGGVPTLAVWGMGDPNRTITGATNVQFADQTHVQVVTSPETFDVIYRFFNDAAPGTVNVVEQRPGQVTIAGRALYFLTNLGVDDATLSIYEVDPDTGQRTGSGPVASYPLSGDGSWGPVSVDPTSTYEFHLVRPGGGSQHLYFQNFPRSDHLVRLLTSEPDAGLDGLWEKSDAHVNLTVVRNKEWWGDQPGHDDVLAIDGTNVINAATVPQSKRAVGIFAFDLGSDGVTDLSAPVPAFFALPFLTGVDVFMPASASGSSTIHIVATPRGGNGPEVINVPNYASSTDRVTVQFHDFHQTDPPVDDGGGDGTTATTAPVDQSTQPSFTG